MANPWSRFRAAAWKGGLLLVATLLVFSAPSRGWAADTAPPLVFAGNGGSLAMTRLLADAFMRQHPDVRIEVPPSLGSKGGIKAVAQGAVTVALSARGLNADELGYGLQTVPYARTSVVLAAHRGVPDDRLTEADLVQIFRGTKSRWRNGEEIILFLLPPEDILPALLTRTLPGLQDAYATAWTGGRWLRVFNETEMNQRLVETSGGFGLASLGAIRAERLPIKVLKIDGPPPTGTAAQAGRSPMMLTLYFVYKPAGLPVQAQAFVEYVRSSGGRRILEENGYQLPN